MQSFRAAPAAKVAGRGLHADSALDSSLQFALWQVALLLLLCCYFGVSRTWRMLQSRLLLPAVRYFFELSPVLSSSPPLAPRCLSHTQKVVKMQIKLETNWAGRQHTHSAPFQGVCKCACVCVCLLLCGPSMGWGFSPFCCLLSAGLAACK